MLQGLKRNAFLKNGDAHGMLFDNLKMGGGSVHSDVMAQLGLKATALAQL
jgi:hypothetical protein